MNNQFAALAECVAHGLEDGWDFSHKVVRQPSKKQLMDALYLSVMQRLITKLAEARDNES